MKTEFKKKKKSTKSEENGGTLIVDGEISMYFWKLEEELAAPGRMQVQGLHGALSVEPQVCRAEGRGSEGRHLRQLCPSSTPPPALPPCTGGGGVLWRGDLRGEVTWRVLIWDLGSERGAGSAQTSLIFHCWRPVATVQTL